MRGHQTPPPERGVWLARLCIQLTLSMAMVTQTEPSSLQNIMIIMLGRGTTWHCTVPICNQQLDPWTPMYNMINTDNTHDNAQKFPAASFNFCLKWWNPLALHLAERGGNVILSYSSNPRELQSCTWSIKCTVSCANGCGRSKVNRCGQMSLKLVFKMQLW
jgi:hypothetical protein